MTPAQLARVRNLAEYHIGTWLGASDRECLSALLADYDRLTTEAVEHAEEVRVLRAGWDGEIAIATEAVNERDKLKSQLSKLHGTVRTYIDAPGQMRGECFRDMQETMLWIDGHDDLLGWPACHARAVAERARLADACRVLIEYRDRAGPLGFQLEKADQYIEAIREAAAAQAKGASDG